MNISRIHYAIVPLLWFAIEVNAATITGGVFTNFCSSGGSLGVPYSGSCADGNSTFTVSGEATGSGLTFGDTISATDNDVDLNAVGNSAYAQTFYSEPVVISTEGSVTLTFDVHGSTSNNNGDYADYTIVADMNNGTPYYFTVAEGTGPGVVRIGTSLLGAGAYDLEISFLARVVFFGDNITEVSRVGQNISLTSDFLNTFQLVGVTDSGGGTVIGSDGTNFTALSAIPEPSSLVLVLGGLIVVMCGHARRHAVSERP
jgi:hypothetical protein